MRIGAYVPILLIISVIGCGDGLTEISGTVTYEGEPVQQGTIRFIDETATSVAHSSTVEDGKYALRVSPGQKRVEIRASRPVPPERQTQPEMGLMYEDYIPSVYNRDSALSANVTTDGKREFDFDLTLPTER